MDDVAKRAEFFDSLETIIKEQKNKLSAVVIQENFIYLRLLTLLSVFDIFRFISMASHKELWGRDILGDEFLCSKDLLGPMPTYLDWNRQTLGQLRKTLANSGLMVFKTGRKINTTLSKYVKLRNNITHNLLFRHSEITTIEREAGSLLLIGEEILSYWKILFYKIAEAEKICTLNAHKSFS